MVAVCILRSFAQRGTLATHLRTEPRHCSVTMNWSVRSSDVYTRTCKHDSSHSDKRFCRSCGEDAMCDDVSRVAFKQILRQQILCLRGFARSAVCAEPEPGAGLTWSPGEPRTSLRWLKSNQSLMSFLPCMMRRCGAGFPPSTRHPTLDGVDSSSSNMRLRDALSYLVTLDVKSRLLTCSETRKSCDAQKTVCV